jgi:hypothetical protein
MANKFHAKKTIIGDLKFDSKKEADYYCILEFQRRAKNEDDRVVEIELQPRFDIIIDGINCGFYKADFGVTYANGVKKIIDVKGLKQGSAYQLFRLKKKIVEALYKIKIIEV